jgi:hypothetical protein
MARDPAAPRMTLERFAARTARRFRGEGADRVAAAIVADAKQLMAYGIEEHAHPRYPWVDRAEDAGTPGEREHPAPVAELPGAER